MDFKQRDLLIEERCDSLASSENTNMKDHECSKVKEVKVKDTFTARLKNEILCKTFLKRKNTAD